ncbi:cytochrome-c peroxidase [Cupriavidus pauculus]|uniref:Cytochrome-c peroxidase n=1 Tax=Cupriavidus pauculus TaxID=82633 RepID=A0A5P2HFJ4_9BURK|nr:cytochrome c peroxidase [Cupriavidus pauculus]QET05919.1 cytochrome-c peroxidase [Cupriavidus pauculus]
MRKFPIVFCLAAAAFSLAACKDRRQAGAPAAAPAADASVQAVAVAVAVAAPAPSKLSPPAQVGQRMFFDPTLSGSGRISCATCHDPAHAYAPANDLSVQLGGADMKQAGTRAVPTLMYKDYTDPYSDEFQNPDMVSPPAPGGGMTWDGRANTIAEQAAIPLLAANEMANPSPDAVVAAIEHGPYAELFRQAYGADVFADRKRAFELAGVALQSFQTEDRSFHPYSSKFDLFRNNKIGGALNEAELHGLRLFVDPNKGNCVACHLIGGGNGGSQDITSDYSFAAIGVPRNKSIPANDDPNYFDMGLCGPLRTDHLPTTANKGVGCGMFKTPILRNVATRHAFMHNGVFHTLDEVVHFYNTRDTEPGRWYSRDAHGKVRKFDDLPARYQANIDDQMPLDGRRAGSKAPMTEDELKDLVTFLNTLTDGYVVPADARPAPKAGVFGPATPSTPPAPPAPPPPAQPASIQKTAAR